MKNLVQRGWNIDQIEYNPYSLFWYMGAQHRTGEHSISACGSTYEECLNLLKHEANVIERENPWIVQK